MQGGVRKRKRTVQSNSRQIDEREGEKEEGSMSMALRVCEPTGNYITNQPHNEINHETHNRPDFKTKSLSFPLFPMKIYRSSLL